MNKIVDNDLKEVCKNILSQNKDKEDWGLVESSDMYQTGNYCGGYDAIEGAFCFSYYEKDIEYWFQITLKEVQEIVQGTKNFINLRLSD